MANDPLQDCGYPENKQPVPIHVVNKGRVSVLLLAGMPLVPHTPPGVLLGGSAGAALWSSLPAGMEAVKDGFFLPSRQVRSLQVFVLQ